MFLYNFLGFMNIIFPSSFGFNNDFYWNYFPAPNPKLYCQNIPTCKPTSIWDSNDNSSSNASSSSYNSYYNENSFIPPQSFDWKQIFAQWDLNNNSQKTQNLYSDNSAKTEENKTQSVPGSIENNDNEQNSSGKITSKDKIDTSKKINLSGNEKTQLINGTYNADYVNIDGIIHYRYNDCKASELDTVNSSVGNGKLRKDAAKAFREMQEAAKKDVITLTCVSGYRSHQYQVDCFNKSDKMRNGIKSRASVSAPSGYSEHHTGLAVDINETSNNFKNTSAYKWLQEHAHEYGFEQSFPAGNAQHLSEESWHFRFVGKNHENDYIFKHAIANDPKMLAKRQ